MKKTLLTLSTILALSACDDSSSKIEEDNHEQVETFETTKVQLQFNLPSDSGILTGTVSLDDSSTYNASVSTLICDPFGNKETLYVFFVNTESQKWDVYFSLEDELLDIEGGEMGDTGQYKASLNFDEAGNFIKQVPYILKTTELGYPEKNYTIEFDFYSDVTTNLDEPFTVYNLQANGC